jgi:hypothetical protein
MYTISRGNITTTSEAPTKAASPTIATFIATTKSTTTIQTTSIYIKQRQEQYRTLINSPCRR